MSLETTFIALSILTICCLLISVVYTAGIVWRAELMLDTSYKYFLLSVILLLGAEILSVLYFQDAKHYIELSIKILRLIGALTFLVAMMEMRDILRKLDGEKDKLDRKRIEEEEEEEEEE